MCEFNWKVLKLLPDAQRAARNALQWIELLQNSQAEKMGKLVVNV